MRAPTVFVAVHLHGSFLCTTGDVRNGFSIHRVRTMDVKLFQLRSIHHPVPILVPGPKQEAGVFMWNHPVRRHGKPKSGNQVAGPHRRTQTVFALEDDMLALLVTLLAASLGALAESLPCPCPGLSVCESYQRLSQVKFVTVQPLY